MTAPTPHVNRYISVQSDLSTSNWALANSVDTEATQWINYLKSVEWALQTAFSYAPQSPSETVKAEPP